MRKSSKHNILVLGMMAAMALCGCESETPIVAEDNPSAVQALQIEIVGGKPEGLAFGSRAVSEPSRFGKCYADELQLWTYRGFAAAIGIGGEIKEDIVTESCDHQILNIDRYTEGNYDGDKDINSVDKVTSTTITAKLRDNHKTGYVIPALAYSKDDITGGKFGQSKFTIIDAEGDVKLLHNQLGITVSPQSTGEYITPELYFGRLKLAVFDNKQKDMSDVSDNLITVIPSLTGSVGHDSPYPDSPIYGKLYRIVSQLNVVTTDVDVSSVEKMELYLSNVPTSLTLYGNHGVYYPVRASNKEEEHKYATVREPRPAEAEDYEYDYILVGSTEEFPKANGSYTATLSTFLLPSEIGRKVRVRIHYKPGTLTDENGTALENQYIDYDIRPENSHLLTGDDAEVYFGGAPENLKNGKDLYVYHHIRDEFYSYSNVKVNIKGKFDKVFLETEKVDVDIEVCPSFEASHPFEF